MFNMDLETHFQGQIRRKIPKMSYFKPNNLLSTLLDLYTSLIIISIIYQQMADDISFNLMSHNLVAMVTGSLLRA